MKKILAMFLVACFILCLSACGNKENSSDLSNDNFQTSSTETQTNTSDETSSPGETKESNSLDGSNNTDNSNNASSSNGSGNSNNTNGSNGSGASNNSNGTNGANNSTTPTHTHKFSNATCTAPAKCSCGATKGSALGHKWQDATCKAPKTCSVCKKTEGASVEHIFDSNGKCEWCKQILPISPAKLQKKSYILTKPIEDSNYGTMIIKSGIDFANEEFWYGDLFYESSFCDVCDTMPTFEHSIWYNGKKYCGFAGAAGGNFTSSLSKNHIFIMFGEDVIIELELLSNNKLRVVEASGNIYKNHISSGDIFE